VTDPGIDASEAPEGVTNVWGLCPQHGCGAETPHRVWGEDPLEAEA